MDKDKIEKLNNEIENLNKIVADQKAMLEEWYNHGILLSADEIQYLASRYRKMKKHEEDEKEKLAVDKMDKAMSRVLAWTRK